MVSDLPAHVLRLDHMPTAAALRAIAKPYNEQGWRTEAEFSHARVILGLDPCRLCNGTRVCPECGGACEICTVPRP